MQLETPLAVKGALVLEVTAKKSPFLNVLVRLADSAFVANGQLVAPLGAAARQHLATIRRFHTLTKAVCFRTFAIVRLESTFWHCYSSELIWSGTVRKRTPAESDSRETHYY